MPELPRNYDTHQPLLRTWSHHMTGYTWLTLDAPSRSILRTGFPVWLESFSHPPYPTSAILFRWGCHSAAVRKSLCFLAWLRTSLCRHAPLKTLLLLSASCHVSLPLLTLWRTALPPLTSQRALLPRIYKSRFVQHSLSCVVFVRYVLMSNVYCVMIVSELCAMRS